jgi:hypothetical protein
MAVVNTPQPVVKPVVSYSLDEVTFFKPQSLVELADTRPIFSEPHIEADLDVICKHIEQATDEGVEDRLWRLEQPEEEPFEDLTDMILAKIDTLDLMAPEVKLTLLEQVKASDQLPWQFFGEHFNELITPEGWLALEEILETSFAMDDGESEVHRRLQGMGYKLMTECRTRLDQAEKLVEEKKAGKGNRPADVYRSFGRGLRWFAEKHDFIPVPSIGETLRELVTAQSMPLNELENPDWVNPYTGEIDDEAEPIVSIKDPVNDPALLGELGWSLEEATAFNNAQEGFNSDDGLDEVSHDEWDVRIPQFMEQQMDLQPTDHLNDLRKEIEWESSSLRNKITRTWDEHWASAVLHLVRLTKGSFKNVNLGILTKACENCLFYALGQERKQNQTTKSLGIAIWKALSSKEQHPARQAVNQLSLDVRKDVRESDEAKAYLKELNRLAIHEAPQDIYILFMAFQHGMAFGAGEWNEDANEFDVDDRQHVHMPFYGTLADFDDQWGEFVLESMNDPRGISSEEPDLAFIEAFSKRTIDAYARMGEWESKNIRLHPAFIKGYFTATSNSKDLTAPGSNACEVAGWEAWRQWKSPEGNKAFHQTGGLMKTKMAAFWKVKNTEERQAQERSIKSITPTGLVLSNGFKLEQYEAELKIERQSSGKVVSKTLSTKNLEQLSTPEAINRKVNWYVASLKIKGGELELSREARARLKSLLSTRGWGKQLLAIL